MSVVVNGTNGLTFADGSTQATGFAPGMRNRIINGDMRIDQRNAGASISVGSSNVYPVDRFAARLVSGSGHTGVQSATTASGFKKSLLITIGTGASPAAGDLNYVFQAIEGYNMADLGWGAAGASTITISFWVRSSLTGTFGGALRNSAGDRSYPFTYSVSSANTFEYKTVTITGDTSGTWVTDNGIGVLVYFDLGQGSTFRGTAGSWAAADYRGATGATNVVATSGATWYVAGVQLEKGSVATPFEYRQYGTEFSLCQRYYEVISSESVSYAIFSTGFGGGSTGYHPIFFKTTKRSQPTISSTAASTFMLDSGALAGTSISFERITSYSARCVVGTGGSVSTATLLMSNAATLAQIYISAEF